MIEREKTDAGFYVRIGPFATEEQARHVEETLRELSAEALANDSATAVPTQVLVAVFMGQRHIERAPGHYTIRVDGGPKSREKVDYCAGATLVGAGKAASATMEGSALGSRAEVLATLFQRLQSR
jgi:hypothetical protein